MFLFDVKLTRANLDTIRDFTVGQDIIRLAHKVFGALGVGAVTRGGVRRAFRLRRRCP